MQDVFESFYLDESKPSAALCRNLTELELKLRAADGDLPEMPEMPGEATFRRFAKTIPYAYCMFFRMGDYAFNSHGAPYIQRMYAGLAPNDWWVADNHTFDIIVRDGEKPVRMYLTAFMDARSRKMVGW
jgi:hypothetical protein